MTLDTIAIIVGAVIGITLVRAGGEVIAERRRIRTRARVVVMDVEIHDPPRLTRGDDEP